LERLEIKNPTGRGAKAGKSAILATRLPGNFGQDGNLAGNFEENYLYKSNKMS